LVLSPEGKEDDIDSKAAMCSRTCGEIFDEEAFTDEELSVHIEEKRHSLYFRATPLHLQPS
jgi:hypothetical protein